MKWKDHSEKQLDLIKKQLHEVQLSLRFEKHSDAYKTSEIILNKLNNSTMIEYYNSLLMVYMWGSKYIIEIQEQSVLNNTILMYNRVKKQLNKMKQRLNLLV